MAKVAPDPRGFIQDQILARWGPEKLAEASARLCTCCSFHILSGRTCRLLPLTLEGADCPYHATNSDKYGEVTWNG